MACIKSKSLMMPQATTEEDEPPATNKIVPLGWFKPNPFLYLFWRFLKYLQKYGEYIKVRRERHSL